MPGRPVVGERAGRDTSQMLPAQGTSTWILVFVIRGSLSLFTDGKTEVQRSRHFH